MSDELQEILDRVDIEAYLEREGITYRPTSGSSGDQFNVKECPSCGNGNWKVYLNQVNGLGNCFSGDHTTGNFNKWKFIAAHLGNPAGGAVLEHIKTFAREQGWQPKRVVSATVSNRPTDWKMPPYYPLPHEGKDLPYLTNRGITREVASYFHLGYAPPGSVYRYMAGGDWRFQDYSRRVIIPIYGMDGTLVTFQGRDITGTAEKKYLFPPQLQGTGVHLYNGFNVPAGAKRIVVNEGAFDVAAVKIALDADQDLREVVAVGTFGKHLSHGGGDDQLSRFAKLKSQGLEEATLMWDGEVQATDDAVDAAILLQGIGLQVRIAMLPKDKDPNDVAPSVVRSCYYSAVPFSLGSAMKIRMLRRQMNGML